MEIATNTLNAISATILLYVFNSTALTIEEPLRNKACLVGAAQILFSFILAMPPILLSNYNIPVLTFLYSLLCVFFFRWTHDFFSLPV